jgi:hypothetical protein
MMSLKSSTEPLVFNCRPGIAGVRPIHSFVRSRLNKLPFNHYLLYVLTAIYFRCYVNYFDPG